ncbi:DUF898 family protein [Devosia albogilva]|uniref:DUF898 family protein n=1 Tax=Devosia albogilva TaxID=429726 RepID=A0ABW5QLY0_9HYPH
MAWGVETEPVRFTGGRGELGWTLLRGYALMLPTIGLYRFWLTTAKRRFYWSNTEIGGDALEYTGSAVQLLLGFLMALAVFVPLYGLFFYLSTQSSEAVVVGYGAVGVILWFLMGYAIYRARDFRLSRTLWRGIRFDQQGSAWRYAVRRFLWSLLVIVTAGLAYPFMALSLWRYRYRNSWFGDRQFGFTGGLKQLVAPYYLAWLVAAVVAVIAVVAAVEGGAFPDEGTANPAGYVPLVLGALVIGVIVTVYRATEMTRMFSSIQLGEATLTVTVSPWRLLGQYLLFGMALIGIYILLAVGGFVVLQIVAGDAFSDGGFDLTVFMQHMQSSLLTLSAIIVGYLLILGGFTWANELFLGYGFWRLVARDARISGLETLASVRARGEDRALGGEGLADALNVGAY